MSSFDPRHAKEVTVWVEGWDADDVYLSDSSWLREGETEDDAIARLIRTNGIVEIGQVEVTRS